MVYPEPYLVTYIFESEYFCGNLYTISYVIDEDDNVWFFDVDYGPEEECYHVSIVRTLAYFQVSFFSCKVVENIYTSTVRILTLLTMVDFSPDFLANNAPELSDFSHGATPSETAAYFRSIGRPELAEAAVRGPANTPDSVFFILTQPWVGGFKEIGKTWVQFVNIDTLWTSFQSEVHTHEWIHNTQELIEGEVGIASFDYTMTPARQSIIYGEVGMTMTLSETDIIEWLTQKWTQIALGRNTQSWYDEQIVPSTLDLVRHLERESGVPMIGPFLNMALHNWWSSREFFARWMRIGGNVSILTRALREWGWDVDDAKKMSEVLETQKENFVIRDIGHAERLVKSYEEAQKSFVLSN